MRAQGLPAAVLTPPWPPQVNGRNVEGLRHAEVVASIKARDDEARLLVVDPETDEHFKRLRVTPTEEHVEGGVVRTGMAGDEGQQPLTHCFHRATSIAYHQRDQPHPGRRVGSEGFLGDIKHSSLMEPSHPNACPGARVLLTFIWAVSA